MRWRGFHRGTKDVARHWIGGNGSPSLNKGIIANALNDGTNPMCIGLFSQIEHAYVDWL
jgi:hypothetical protein